MRWLLVFKDVLYHNFKNSYYLCAVVPIRREGSESNIIKIDDYQTWGLRNSGTGHHPFNCLFLFFGLDRKTSIEKNRLIFATSSPIARRLGSAGRYRSKPRGICARSSAAFARKGSVVFRMFRSLAARVTRTECVNKWLISLPVLWGFLDPI